MGTPKDITPADVLEKQLQRIEAASRSVLKQLKYPIDLAMLAVVDEAAQSLSLIHISEPTRP